MHEMEVIKFDRRTCLKSTIGFLAAQNLFGWPSSLLGEGVTSQPARALSVKESLQLAGQHLIAILNPEDNYLPYWQLTVQKDSTAYLARFWPAHNIGRWWDAMLRLENAIGFEIPKPIEKAMLENTKRFFDNPDRICLNPEPHPLHSYTIQKGLQWDLHSLREGLLALNALARWRQDAWAADMGHQMIESVNSKLRDDGSWDIDKFDARQKRGPQVIHNLEPSDTHGRMLEAVIWFFETTGDPTALSFANRVAEWHLKNTTQADGHINPAGRTDHTHSYLGTLRGLLLYGRLTHQHEYIDRVASAYRVNIPRVVKESGYTSHNMVVESIGETTSPGDAAQLALWLTKEGYSEFLDDADRIVRCRLLPSQILNTPKLKPDSKFGVDAVKDLEQRIIGAYGGCHSHPHGGKVAVTDVTAADVHTLVDVYRNIVVDNEATQEIFFHLDYEDARMQVTSQRAERAELAVTPKQETAVAIRVPKWTPRESIQVFVNDKAVAPVYAGNFLHLGRRPAGARIVMKYDLPERTTKETDLGTEYTINWKGDDIVGVAPNTDRFPMYPSISVKE